VAFPGHRNCTTIVKHHKSHFITFNFSYSLDFTLPVRCRDVGLKTSSFERLNWVRQPVAACHCRRSPLLLLGAGPRLWNSLPADVQMAPSLTTFRQKLRTFISAIILRHCSLAASLAIVVLRLVFLR